MALEKFRELIVAQGGDPRANDEAALADARAHVAGAITSSQTPVTAPPVVGEVLACRDFPRRACKITACARFSFKCKQPVADSAAPQLNPYSIMKNMLKLIVICFAFALVATPAAIQAQDKAVPAKTQKTTRPKSVPKIDINTASAGQLTTISGIDADTAAKIIAGRPYGNKGQLKSKNIISADLYTKITDHIVARQPKKDGASPKAGKGKGKSKEKAAQ